MDKMWISLSSAIISNMLPKEERGGGGGGGGGGGSCGRDREDFLRELVIYDGWVALEQF